MKQTLKSSHILKATAAFVLVFVTMGCSVQGEITDLTDRISTPNLGQSVGLASGAQTNMNVNGYKVSASLGDYSSGIVQEVNGYKVYTSVEGNIASDANTDSL